MRLSKAFLKTYKEAPKEAEVISHKLMLRASMIRQLTRGVYSYLPLGYKVLKKIENIVREEMDRAGSQEILMPVLQPASLWEESGRWFAYGWDLRMKKLLRILLEIQLLRIKNCRLTCIKFRQNLEMKCVQDLVLWEEESS